MLGRKAPGAPELSSQTFPLSEGSAQDPIQPHPVHTPPRPHPQRPPEIKSGQGPPRSALCPLLSHITHHHLPQTPLSWGSNLPRSAGPSSGPRRKSRTVPAPRASGGAVPKARPSCFPGQPLLVLEDILSFDSEAAFFRTSSFVLVLNPPSWSLADTVAVCVCLPRHQPRLGHSRHLWGIDHPTGPPGGGQSSPTVCHYPRYPSGGTGARRRNGTYRGSARRRNWG